MDVFGSGKENLKGIELTYGLGEKEARRPTPKWNTRFYLAFSIRA